MDPANNNQNDNQTPVVNPAVDATANPNVSIPVIDPSLVEQEPAGNADFSVVSETQDVMVGATDPITMPNLPKAPDPIEEELKAPMKAADPVPGSIGSAISVPAEQLVEEDVMVGVSANPEMPANNTTPRTPNVAFNDPASVQGQAAPAPQPQVQMKPVAPAKKKMSKQTLIMLCAIAGIVVVALVIVLVMMLNQ